jgi:hypothetical protein
MRISENDLLALEGKGIIVIQSDFKYMVYAIDSKHKVLWLMNRKTGAQIEIAKENVFKFADELLNVAEVYFGKKGA